MSTSSPGPADRGGSWKLKAVLVVGLVAAVAVAVWLSDRGDSGMLAEVSPVVTEPYRSQPCEPRTAVDGTLADVGIVAVGYTLEGAQYRPDLWPSGLEFTGSVDLRNQGESTLAFDDLAIGLVVDGDTMIGYPATGTHVRGAEVAGVELGPGDAADVYFNGSAFVCAAAEPTAPPEGDYGLVVRLTGTATGPDGMTRPVTVDSEPLEMAIPGSLAGR